VTKLLSAPEKKLKPANAVIQIRKIREKIPGF
jgi:hypothetical protein